MMPPLQPVNRGPRITPQIVVGLGIVAMGLLLTAGNLGWVEVDDLWRYWPLIIIAGGLAKFVTASSMAGRVTGTVFMIVGALWLGDNFHVIRFRVWDWWPLVFVLIGLRLISRSRPTPDGAGVGTVTADQVVSGFAFWSTFRRRIVSTAFKHADLTAIMGGIELDLRGASTPGEAVIDVFAMWGGIEIKVPPDWAVSNQAMAIMGGIEDKSNATSDARQRLIIRGFALMGGVEIKT
jgi:predicted membrane protein